MSVRYAVRMQFGPHQDSAVIREELLATCRAGWIDEVIFFAFAEEQNDGHDRLERIHEWLEAIRPWKRALEAEGVAVSFNPWHSLLHCDRHRRLKPDQPWQRMVDWRGRAAKAVVCPLDPGWRAYYAEALRVISAEGFRVVWVDDDIRYHNHEPLDWGGCWCRLHIAEFNRRAESQATREEIVSRVLKAGEPHPWRALWFEMWDECQRELVDMWREIVESAGSRLGLMSSQPEVHAVEGRTWARWWPALAQQRPPVHRPHFWGYSECGSEALVNGIRQMQMNRMVQLEEVESLPEIENFPYGRWNKSFRQTVAQMALAQVFGSNGLAVSLYDFMGNLPSDEPERAAFLAGVKPMLGWLGEQFPPSLTSVGVGTPWHPDMSRLVHTDDQPFEWETLLVDTGGWDHWLGAFGFAFQKRAQKGVNALSGAMPWAFDDATLRGWLGHGLLLDGPAAAVLVKREFGPGLGIEDARFITQEDVLYSMEETVDAEFGLRKEAQMSLNADKPYKERLLQGRLHPNARVISVLKDPLQKKVGHGAFLFENSLGGRVAVMPWDVTAGQNLCAQRHAQLDKVLAWLSRGRSYGAVYGAAWLVPQFLRDGTQWRGVVWNAGADAVREFHVRPPAGMPPITRAVQGDAEGNLIEAYVEHNTIRLAAPLRQWEFVVLNPEGPLG